MTSSQESTSYLKKEFRFEGAYDAKVFLTLKAIYKPFKLQVALALVAGFVGRLLLLLNTNVVGWWADSIINNKSSFGDSLSTYLGLMLLFTCLGLGLTLVFRVSFSRLSARAVSLLYDEVTFRTSRFPVEFFDRNPVGRIVTRFSTDYGNVFRIFGGPLSEFVSLAFDLIAMTALIGFAHPLFFPIFLAMLVLQAFVYFRKLPLLRQDRREQSALRGPSISHFAETAQGSSQIRVFGREGEFRERFTRLDSQFQNQKLKVVGRLQMFSGELAFLTGVGMLGLGSVGLWGQAHQNMSLAALGVAFGFVVLSGQSMQAFFEWLINLEESLSSMERLSHYLHLPQEPGARLPVTSRIHVASDPPKEDALEFQSFKKLLPRALGIAAQGLNFRYDVRGPLILDGVSFQIKPGEHLGIVGKTGSGKSTVLSLLSALYPVESGRISIGNYSTGALSPEQAPALTLLPVESFRSMISAVTQESFMVVGSLRENIDPDEALNPQDIEELLQEIGLAHCLKALGGLDGSVGEKGSNLSAGERQLVCLARAILRPTPVVIFDEATSHVDPATEFVMSQAADRWLSKNTRITVAHRLTTVERCDQILWLDGGKVRGFGRPQQILEAFRSH